MRYAELIERLEKAEGPDRELDADIAKLCHPTDDPSLASFENGRDYPDLYTASTDAADTLLPWDLHPGATFTVREIQSSRGRYVFAEFTWPSTQCQGRSRTKPLATCIAALCALRRTEQEYAHFGGTAALKARAALTQREGGGV